MQELQVLGCKLGACIERYAGDVCAWPRKRADQARADGIADGGKDNRDGARGAHGCLHDLGAHREDHVYLLLYQSSQQVCQMFLAAFGRGIDVAILKRNAAALDVAKVPKALVPWILENLISRYQRPKPDPDHTWRLGCLRTQHRMRGNQCRGGDQRDDSSADHEITPYRQTEMARLDLTATTFKSTLKSLARGRLCERHR